MNIKTFSDVTAAEVNAYFVGKKARLAKSKKFTNGERVREARSGKDYYFVSSMRWLSHPRFSIGGYLLFNPRTGNLASATTITSMESSEFCTIPPAK